MANRLSTVFPVFHDNKGKELESGKIYIGTENLNPETNPISVYWDKALTQAAVQPIRTIAGRPDRNGSAGNIFTAGRYSITVKDKNDKVVYTGLSEPSLTSAATISYNLNTTGSVDRDINNKLSETAVSPEDFGYSSSTAPSAADDLAITRAIEYCSANNRRLYLPNTYIVNSGITPTIGAGKVHWYGGGKFQFRNGDGIGIYIGDLSGKDFICEGITFDGNYYVGSPGYCRHALWLIQDGFVGSKIEFFDCEFKRTRQPASSANGNEALIIQADVEAIRIVNCNFEDIVKALSAGTSGSNGSAGLSIQHRSDYIEQIIIDGCTFENISNSETSATAYNTDTDGLRIILGGYNESRYAKSSASISNCKFINCKGRGVKAQIDNIKVTNCHFYRNESGTSPGAGDVNFQINSGIIEGCTFVYEENPNYGSPGVENTMIRPISPISFYQGADSGADRHLTIDNIRVYNYVPRYETANNALDLFADLRNAATTNSVTTIANISNVIVKSDLNYFADMPGASGQGQAFVNMKNVYVHDMKGTGALQMNATASTNRIFASVENFVNAGGDNVITAISNSGTAIVTTSDYHTFNNGDHVIINHCGGMTEVNNKRYTVANANAAAKTFELLGINSGTFGTYTSGGVVRRVVRPSWSQSSTTAPGDFYHQLSNCFGFDVQYDVSKGTFQNRSYSETGLSCHKLGTPFRSIGGGRCFEVEMLDGETIEIPCLLNNGTGLILAKTTGGASSNAIMQYDLSNGVSAAATGSVGSLWSMDSAGTPGTNPATAGKFNIWNSGNGCISINNLLGSTRTITLFIWG